MNIRKKELVGVFFGLGALCALDCDGMLHGCPIPDPNALPSSVNRLRQELRAARAAWPVVVLPDGGTLLGANEVDARGIRQTLLVIGAATTGARQNPAAISQGSQNQAETITTAANAAQDVGLYEALVNFTNGIVQANETYAQQALNGNDPRGGLNNAHANNLLATYMAFAGAVGHVDAANVDAAHGNFQARVDGGNAADRTRAGMIAGLTPANLRAYGGTAGGGLNNNNGRLALYLGLTGLAEIAEYGTIGGQNGQLENGNVAEGYTDAILNAMNAIIADLHN